MREENRIYRDKHKSCPDCGKNKITILTFSQDIITNDTTEIYCTCGWNGTINDLVPDHNDGEPIIELHELWYGRYGIIEVGEAICHGCKQKKQCLVIDASEGEYGTANICKDCVEKMFADTVKDSQLY